jgi:hypothetical protein
MPDPEDPAGFLRLPGMPDPEKGSHLLNVVESMLGNVGNTQIGVPPYGTSGGLQLARQQFYERRLARSVHLSTAALLSGP